MSTTPRPVVIAYVLSPVPAVAVEAAAGGRVQAVAGTVWTCPLELSDAGAWGWAATLLEHHVAGSHVACLWRGEPIARPR